MKWVIFAGVLALLGVAIGGCASGEPAGDYQEPAEGTYQQSSEVPNRAGRTRAQEPSSQSK